jgi:hypothetical protein
MNVAPWALTVLYGSKLGQKCRVSQTSRMQRPLEWVVPKRQRTGAVQDASRILKGLRRCASFWTAGVFCRFSNFSVSWRVYRYESDLIAVPPRWFEVEDFVKHIRSGCPTIAPPVFRSNRAFHLRLVLET